jgi:DNA repair exonuclease SbcCD ATPase subunit
LYELFQSLQEIDKLLESIPNIEETLNGLIQQMEANEETPIDPDQLEEQQSEFESKMNNVAEILQKGSQLLEEIRNDSSEELQDVCLLDERLARLQDEYRHVVDQWEKNNESRLIDESIASFKHDSKLVRITNRLFSYTIQHYHYFFIIIIIMLCQFHTIISTQIQTQEYTNYQSINQWQGICYSFTPITAALTERT